MKELIYGTNNPAKLKHMKDMTKGLPVKIISLAELDMDLWEPEETSNDLLTNAEIKARGYFEQIGRPVFSCDSGLYFDEVNPEDQPGGHIRRIHGQNLKDEEFIDYYGKLATKYGGLLTARYRNSICLVMDKNTVYKYDGEDLSSPRFGLIDKPHHKYRPGFPLDTISIHLESGQYYYDLDKTKYDYVYLKNGFRNFFKRRLNE